MTRQYNDTDHYLRTPRQDVSPRSIAGWVVIGLSVMVLAWVVLLS